MLNRSKMGGGGGGQIGQNEWHGLFNRWEIQEFATVKEVSFDLHWEVSLFYEEKGLQSSCSFLFFLSYEVSLPEWTESFDVPLFWCEGSAPAATSVHYTSTSLLFLWKFSSVQSVRAHKNSNYNSKNSTIHFWYLNVIRFGECARGETQEKVQFRTQSLNLSYTVTDSVLSFKRIWFQYDFVLRRQHPGVV